jgi:hypothetical protein
MGVPRGRGRTLAGRALEDFWLKALKRGTIIYGLCELQEKGEYKEVKNVVGVPEKVVKGMVKEEVLYEALKRDGIPPEQTKEIVAELMREGYVYSPRVGWLKTTEPCGKVE